MGGDDLLNGFAEKRQRCAPADEPAEVGGEAAVQAEVEDAGDVPGRERDPVAQVDHPIPVGDFPGGDVDPIRVLVSGADATNTGQFAKAIARVPHVTGAVMVANKDASSLLAVSYEGGAGGGTAREVVDAIRALPAPSGAEVLVGGVPADTRDLLDSLRDGLPWMALVAAITTMILLFLAFGSILLPVKAVLMNLVSITAAFGVVVWAFQGGHLAKIMDFTNVGYLDATNPILMLAVLFGLSTDYEVFLLSRMREEWDRTGDNAAAVAAGLARTGRIITWAAILLVIVIGGFSTGGLTFVKMIGVGMIVAILVDATVVRALLVPAFMKVMGRANWWAPGVLGRFYQRYGVREDESEGPVKAKRIHEPVAEIADQPAPTLPRPRRPQEATTSTRT